MAGQKTLVGIDIGTAKIRTVIATMDDPKQEILNIIGIGVAPSNGIRKGVVVDIEETIRAVTHSVEDAERMAGEPVRDGFVAIGGNQLQTTFSRGVVAVGQSGHEISSGDVERVLEAAQSVALPPNQQVIKTVARNFIVDDQEKIKDPVGMTGIRLDADALIISGSVPFVRNIEKCVHEAGVGVLDFIPTPLAAAAAVLDRRQKELGVCVIDIGAGSTSIAVYEEGGLIHATTIGLGAENITNDVAIGLRSSIDTAEKVKIQHGHSVPAEVNKREQINLATDFSANQRIHQTPLPTEFPLHFSLLHLDVSAHISQPQSHLHSSDHLFEEPPQSHPEDNQPAQAVPEPLLPVPPTQAVLHLNQSAQPQQAKVHPSLCSSTPFSPCSESPSPSPQ